MMSWGDDYVVATGECSMRQAMRALMPLLFVVIYLWLWIAGYHAAWVADAQGVKVDSSVFTTSMASLFSTVAGLVSSAVLLELGLTKPGEIPAGQLMSPRAQREAKDWQRVVFAIYFLVWTITGFASLVQGLKHPDTLPTLTNFGTAWFGLLLSAWYAYFGIHPSDAPAAMTSTADKEEAVETTRNANSV